MGLIGSISIDAPLATSIGSSRARSPPTCRSGSDQVRIGCQPQDCEGARPHRASNAVGPSRRGDRMNRREFMSLIGGTAATLPVAVRAQQAMPVIGFLGSQSLSQWTERLRTFKEGLRSAG